MNALVGNFFCSFCLGKQLYRAAITRETGWYAVKIKCRVCGQGEQDPVRVAEQTTMKAEVQGASSDAEQGRATPPTGATIANKGIGK